MSFPWWMLTALAAGTLSYYGLERPLLKLRERFRVAEPEKAPLNNPTTPPALDKLAIAQT